MLHAPQPGAWALCEYLHYRIGEIFLQVYMQAQRIKKITSFESTDVQRVTPLDGIVICTGKIQKWPVFFERIFSDIMYNDFV